MKLLEGCRFMGMVRSVWEVLLLLLLLLLHEPLMMLLLLLLLLLMMQLCIPSFRDESCGVFGGLGQIL